MLKGNVKITLYDKDGNVTDSRESSNLVTNASAKILNYCAGANGRLNTNLLYSHMPVAETTLGGLLLFEDPITDPDAVDPSDADPTADTILVPNNNYIVACADRNNDSTSTRRGSLNTTESDRTSTGYKSVWDFSTSQAQGQISALALTSTECGLNPFACYFETWLKSFDSFKKDRIGSVTYYVNRMIPLKYDVSTQEFYFAYQSNDTSPYLYKICKVRIPFYTFNVEDYAYEAGYVVELSDSFSTPYTIQPNYSAIDILGGYAYLGYSIVYDSNLPYLKYKKLNLSSFTCSDECTRRVHRSSSNCFTVSNGIWYEVDNNMVIYGEQEDGTNVFTYDLRNEVPSISGSVQLLPKSNNTVEVMPTSSISVGGWVLYPYTTQEYQNGYYDKINNGTYYSNIYFPFETDLLKVFKSDSALYFYIKKDYLGTIFNLDTPVNKTNATSMKVEYTLTNVTS